MSKGDFAAWARGRIRAPAAPRAAAAAPVPVLVTPAGRPIAPTYAPVVMPAGTFPWGVAAPGSPGVPAARGPVGMPPNPMFTMQPKSTIMLNQDDGVDRWAERIAQLPELVPSDGSDANAGQYNADSIAALRAAAGGTSGARHVAHTIGAGGAITGSQAIGDVPVPIGALGLMAPVEYGQRPMLAARGIPLRPGNPRPVTHEMPTSPAPAPSPEGPADPQPADPFLASLGMLEPPPAPPPAAIAPQPPAVSSPPVAVPAPTASNQKQLSLLGD